jgi:hypothetical protein
VPRRERKSALPNKPDNINPGRCIASGLPDASASSESSGNSESNEWSMDSMNRFNHLKSLKSFINCQQSWNGI